MKLEIKVEEESKKRIKKEEERDRLSLGDLNYISTCMHLSTVRMEQM